MPSLVKNVANWAGLRSAAGSGNSGMAGLGGAPTALPQIDMCEICGKKPKFVDNGFKHPYCSRSCARNGQGPNPTGCLLRGCRATGKPAFANFCSDAHAREGVRTGRVPGCDQCKVQPRSVGNNCIPCERQLGGAPRLRELRSDGATFNNLRIQFQSEWDSASPAPRLEKAYEVVLPRDSRMRYGQYKAVNPGLVEVRSFHSSQCICDLGYKDSTLCTIKSCGICSTVKSTFKSFAFGVPFNKGRFGDGVYSYRNPALADRFATSCTSSPFRVMIACDVSVEPGQCSDEQQSLFVPVADGILPTYVLMYIK